ncbi:hypothetical protein ACLKA6_012229 [Drosophila palustris]
MEASKQQNKSRIELFDNEERVKLIEDVQQILWVQPITNKRAKHGTSVEEGDRQAEEDNRQAGKHFWLILGISAAVYWSTKKLPAGEAQPELHKH